MKINWILVGATVILGFLYAQERRVNLNLTFLKELQDSELNIMEDECREYQFELSNKPTFDDGYKAALLKRNAGNYSDGYEDAKIVFDGSNNYAQGYHAAITQFGFLKDLSKASADKLLDAKIVKEKEKETPAQGL